MNTPKKVIIAGGGTGGHLYPGIAVAREMQKKWPQVEIQFVGSERGLETRIIPNEGFQLHTLSVGGLIRTGRIQQILTLIKMPFVFLKCLMVFFKIKPDVVLGIGGFASGPFVLVSSLLTRNTYIWEPNAHPGFTNRILSKFVRRSFLVFEDAIAKLKSKNYSVVGLPIRKSISFNPRTSSDSFRVLVFGGSQGARAINECVLAAVKRGGDWLDKTQIVHQTGPLDFQRISAEYGQNPLVEVKEYLNDMPKRYEWADLVIGRGGVSTVSEIIATRKASILIPLPTAAENHQQSNVEFLVRANAGEMILQRDLTPDLLIKKILEYKHSPNKIKEMETKLASLYKGDGAQQIVDIIQGEWANK